jgi:hypothetical protein
MTTLDDDVPRSHGFTIWTGEVTAGNGFVSKLPAQRWPSGFVPGTLNLEPTLWPLRGWLRDRPATELGFDREQLKLGEHELAPVLSPGVLLHGLHGIPVVVMCWSFLWVEVAAKVHLREHLDLVDGDIVQLRVEVVEPDTLARYVSRFFPTDSGSL